MAGVGFEFANALKERIKISRINEDHGIVTMSFYLDDWFLHFFWALKLMGEL